ncbi:MAG: hypothetical protein ABIP06_14945 [Pyrinomonadaceae bacterium]
MNVEVNSTNPTVRAIISGSVPRPAQLAAARGILPLPQSDLLEILVSLATGDDTELSTTARQTLALQNNDELELNVKSGQIAPNVLSYFSVQENLSVPVYEAILTNPKTPQSAVVNFARTSQNGELLELVSQNQQLLIQTPAIIDAIIANPFRTAEAERRAAEIKREFFEKERGAQQIANELRAQGKNAAAEFIEQAEFSKDLQDFATETNLSYEDAMLLAELIEVSDAETDDSWLALEYLEDIYEETEQQRQEIVDKILGEFKLEDENSISGDRVSMIQRIMRMTMKDRIKLAGKGDREARNILVRDPNRIVAQAVIKNAKITDQEVEKIAAMRTVPEDVLRQIFVNKKWARNYTVMHNLARNPRTSIANAMNILTRLQLKDLDAIAKNRNVAEAVRKQSARLVSLRKGGRS